MGEKTKNYEIAYLLSSGIPEEEVLTYVGKLTAAIESVGGSVGRAEEPQKRKLAYPIKKERFAYFGYTTFSLENPRGLAELEKKIKLESKVLRYLITEEVSQPPVRKLYIRERREPQLLKETQQPPAVTKREPEEKEKLDIVELDKKLEEILGK
jgi:ribosomal protein S6